MLSNAVKGLKDISLEKVNEFSMDIARELVREDFDMNSLADVEVHIMDLARDRMSQLGCKFDKEEHFIQLAGLTVEISLFLGITIGRNNK